MKFENVSKSQLIGIVIRLNGLSMAMKAVGGELVECGLILGNGMINAGNIAEELVQKLAEEATKR